MGGRSSKVVITPETTNNAPEGTITPLKGFAENGNGEAIPAIDAASTENEQNGDAQPADVTSSTVPATEASVEPKKKADPIKWIQKKISFKKNKTPKKSDQEEAPAETTAQEEKEKAVLNAGDVEVQSEEVPKVDQATTANPETGVAESSEEDAVMEIAPTSNGLRAKVGKEEFIEEPPKYPVEQEESALPEVADAAPEEEEVAEEESKVNLDLSEKLANLGIESAAPQTNGGLESHAVNGDGDAVVASDEA